MARGFIINFPHTKTTSLFIQASIHNRVSFSKNFRNGHFVSTHLLFSSSSYIPSSSRLLCSCFNRQDYPIDISKYKETFSNRMSLMGLLPHHRIALGVSGGPDSIALCVLAADWKTSGLNAASTENSEFVDGLLAIIVDHGLRVESKDEAEIVHRRVSDMGIRCEIAHCEWSNGGPKLGHLQEAARDMRYQKFHNICSRHQIGVLLIAHHADDQAELFILRLSRNSGVLGLAGMASASQLFATCPNPNGGASSSILLVRPLLDLSKEDMYKICQGSNQEWVEDPTNRSPIFARNRIRMSLGNLSSSIFKSELQAIISACRRTRFYVDQFCHTLINQAVTTMPQGYAVIDLAILNPSKVQDICLSKFVSLLLQFISQRHRPVRGSALKLLLDYFHTFPCKTSLTAAGCYLCAAPGSKGTKLLICCSVGPSLPLKMELFHISSLEGQKFNVSSELEQIVAHGKSYSDKLVPDASDVHFLDVMPAESVLTEAKRLSILSESTLSSILSLQKVEIEHFKSKTETVSDCELQNIVESVRLTNELRPGQICYFMNRFLISWELSNRNGGDAYCMHEADYCCRSCLVGNDLVMEVRNMVDADWLYLAKLSKSENADCSQQKKIILDVKTEQGTVTTNVCSHFARVSAHGALVLLKSIPVAARRSLPVLVSPQGTILSIPSVYFNICPCLKVSSEFKPRVPLGGGHSSFLCVSTKNGCNTE